MFHSKGKREKNETFPRLLLTADVQKTMQRSWFGRAERVATGLATDNRVQLQCVMARTILLMRKVARNNPGAPTARLFLAFLRLKSR